MDKHTCRACYGSAGDLVLDLGEQPACDYFPQSGDPGPDPVYPLQMWLCSSCGLAQLLADPTVPEEPRGTEPAALVAQAADAVARVAAAGFLPDRGVVAEYGSPHGGSWLELLAARGLVPSGPGGQADVILDCFGLMHAADQHRALAERAARVAPGGVLLLQYHALSTIIGHQQWNALRHGHFAYYSTTALTAMLAAVGFTPRTAWHFDLYGGTVLLAASRDGEAGSGPDDVVRSLLEQDARVGVRDPGPSLAFSAMCRPTLRPCMTGWWPSDPPEARFWATAPRRGRSRCCAMRTWIARCCPRWLTPPRPSRGGGCRELTFRWPIPPSSPRAGQTRYCSSSRTCWPKSGLPTRRSRPQAAGGSTLRHLAHEACSRTRSRARHRPRVGPMLPTGSPSSSDMSA